MSTVVPPMINTPDNFKGGKIFYASSVWGSLTKDIFIHNVVHGKFLDFASLPSQNNPPSPLKLSTADSHALDIALSLFLKQQIIERCEPEKHGFFSNVFPFTKIDGTTRVILNLKELNNHITHIHFKLDTLKDVIQLIHPHCFIITMDLKDAYFSVFVKPEDRKWLQFMWKDQFFRFTCLPQGLTSAPRIFTKLLKPALSHLRKRAILVVCYLDDCIFIAESEEELTRDAHYAMQFFDSLGLTINVKKSVLEPTQEITFLGVVLNSVAMTAALPPVKKDRIKTQGRLLLKGEVTMLDLSSFIGLAVASDPAIELAPLRYKYLEIFRNRTCQIPWKL